METRIGISGWTYAPWRGVFYPKDLPHNRELEHASRQLNSIEINGSFYSLQKPSSYAKWRDETPDDFVFAMKGGRFITHMKKLKDVRVPLANFFASGVLALRGKLGPILWQLPATFAFDEARFRDFFKLLPRTTNAAAKLAREHDPRLAGRVLTETDANRPMRYAIEVRHASFRDQRFTAMLREHNVALVIVDTPDQSIAFDDLTADFIYCRLHGDAQRYPKGYPDAVLDAWAKRIRKWTKGKSARDAFVYFDDEVKVHSPDDATALAKRLRGVVTPPGGRR